MRHAPANAPPTECVGRSPEGTPGQMHERAPTRPNEVRAVPPHPPPAGCAYAPRAPARVPRGRRGIRSGAAARRRVLRERLGLSGSAVVRLALHGNLPQGRDHPADAAGRGWRGAFGRGKPVHGRCATARMRERRRIPQHSTTHAAQVVDASSTGSVHGVLFAPRRASARRSKCMADSASATETARPASSAARLGIAASSPLRPEDSVLSRMQLFACLSPCYPRHA